MTEQQENELLCEKLLGWKRAVRGALSGCQFWDTEPTQLRTPDFRTGDGMLLLLEALQAEYKRTLAGPIHTVIASLGRLLANGELTPAAVRAAALEYARPLP